MKSAIFRLTRSDNYYQLAPIIYEDKGELIQKPVWVVVRTLPGKVSSALFRATPSGKGTSSSSANRRCGSGRSYPQTITSPSSCPTKTSTSPKSATMNSASNSLTAKARRSSNSPSRSSKRRNRRSRKRNPLIQSNQPKQSARRPTPYSYRATSSVEFVCSLD